MADLLPCPFCGKQPERLESKFWTGMRHDVIRVEYRCHCDGLAVRQRGFVQISGVTDAEALEAWNRRVPAKTALDSFIDDVEAADIRDAARYRWLRTPPNNINACVYGPTFEKYCGGLLRRGEYLDHAIDEAMKGEQP